MTLPRIEPGVEKMVQKLTAFLARAKKGQQ
jgi:hypothetical protein